MKKKPITTFLKVMSILILIQSVLGILINGLAIFLTPLVEEPIGPTAWMSLIVSIICEIVNLVLAVMALQHKKIDLVYKISLFTFIAPIVFSSVEAGGVSGFLSIVASAVIPALFLAATFKQDKIDRAQ